MSWLHAWHHHCSAAIHCSSVTAATTSAVALACAGIPGATAVPAVLLLILITGRIRENINLDVRRSVTEPFDAVLHHSPLEVVGSGVVRRRDVETKGDLSTRWNRRRQIDAIQSPCVVVLRVL